MTTEQKLREALQAFEKAGTGFDICPTRRLPQSEDARRVDEWWLRYFMEADLSVRVRARQALATTEPEPTGMPELPEPDLYAHELLQNSGGVWLGVNQPGICEISHVPGETGDEIRSYFTLCQLKTYGEQCWKAGYKHEQRINSEQYHS